MPYGCNYNNASFWLVGDRPISKTFVVKPELESALYFPTKPGERGQLKPKGLKPQRGGNPVTPVTHPDKSEYVHPSAGAYPGFLDGGTKF